MTVTCFGDSNTYGYAPPGAIWGDAMMPTAGGYH